LPGSSPLKEGRDTRCSSHSPIKAPIELGRSVISVTKRNFGEEVFKYKGAIHPRLREARLSAPLTPLFVIYICILLGFRLPRVTSLLPFMGTLEVGYLHPRK